VSGSTASSSAASWALVGGDLDPAHEARAFVSRHMRLVPVHRLAPAVPGPARLAVMADAGQGGQSRVHQGTCSHHHAISPELTRDGPEQHPVKAAPDQFAPDADEAGAFWRRLMLRKAAEPPEARSSFQRLGEPHVREVVVGRE
jgi:hypothetical protein